MYVVQTSLPFHIISIVIWMFIDWKKTNANSKFIHVITHRAFKWTVGIVLFIPLMIYSSLLLYIFGATDYLYLKSFFISGAYTFIIVRKSRITIKDLIR